MLKTNKKNKIKHIRGFTLVELLVAVSILGIILIIAIPKLIDLKDENKETKYVKYSESVKSASKLYIDSYSKDLFGNNQTGCKIITFDELKNKGLVKDYKQDGITCDTYNAGNVPATYVKVIKSNDNYTYDIAIKCVDKTNKIVYEKKLEGNGSCDGIDMDTVGPSLAFSKISEDWYQGKDAKGNPDKVTITISDVYGLLENTTISYAWAQEGETPTDFKKLEFKNNRGIKSVKGDILVPQNATGKYYLTIKTDKVRDANGTYMAVNKRTHKTGLFKLDNTKPEIVSTTNSSDNIWTKSSVEVTANAKDDHSGIKKIYYTYNSSKYDSLKSDWKKTTPTSAERIWKDSINKKVYIVAEDKAGNKSVITPAGTIKIDKENPTTPTSGSLGSISASSGTDSIGTSASGSTDDYSGVKEYLYIITTSSSVPEKNDERFTTNKSFATSCGTKYYAYAVAVDYVGNKSNVKSLGSSKTESCCSKTKTSYGSYSSCEGSCGNGKKTRKVYEKSVYDESICSTTIEEASCDTGISCCSKTKTYCEGWSSCEGECGTGVRKRKCTYTSAYTGENCGSYIEPQDCDTGKSCETPAPPEPVDPPEPPGHVHQVGVLGTSLKPCNWKLSCGTYHIDAYWGYCGVCWNYGKKYRADTYKYCPGQHRDGCKNFATLYPTVVPD